jgi:hypothetical protein
MSATLGVKDKALGSKELPPHSHIQLKNNSDELL